MELFYGKYLEIHINGSPRKRMEHEIKRFFYSNDVLNCKFMLKVFFIKIPFLC